jgi:hypothetical protein
LRRLDALLSHFATLPVPDDGHLQFRGFARAAFTFLVREFRFSEIEDSPLGVTFASEELRVELTYWPGCR